MIVDCDRCQVRGRSCGDCVIGVLLGAPVPDAPGGLPSGAPIVQLDARERRAIDVLADQGLVPRLRLVAAPARRTTTGPQEVSSVRHAG